MKQVQYHAPRALCFALTGCLMLCLAAACTTTGGAKADKATADGKESKGPEKPKFPRVTLQQGPMPLSDTVRKIGETSGGGLVIMNGLEEHAVSEMNLKNAPYETMVETLAAAVQCRYQALSGGYFIFPEGYEPLLAVSLEGKLPQRFQELRASIALGGKTLLCNAFAVIGQSMGITVIPDNYIADARCGEMFMDNAPLPEILRALLMSARVPADGFVVEATDEYVFIRSVRNTNPASLLEKEEQLTDEQRAMLDRVVDVVLPSPGADPLATAFSAKASPLKDILTPLTRQFNVEVAAKRSMADIPVNPCVMKQVRIRTAMSLLLRQWPVDSFTFEVNGAQLLMRPR